MKQSGSGLRRRQSFVSGFTRTFDDIEDDSRGDNTVATSFRPTTGRSESMDHSEASIAISDSGIDSRNMQTATSCTKSDFVKRNFEPIIPSSPNNDLELVGENIQQEKPMSYIRVARDMTVELHEGSFFKIRRIIKREYEDGNKQYLLVGSMFRRTKYLKALSKKANEVARVHQNLHIPIEDIVAVRKLVTTNKPFPECRNIGEDGWLTCRWVYNLDERAKGRDYRKFRYIRRIKEEEADTEHRVEDKTLRENWLYVGYTGDEIRYEGHGNNLIDDEAYARQLDARINDTNGAEAVDLDDDSEGSVGDRGVDECAQSSQRLSKHSNQFDDSVSIPAAIQSNKKIYTFGDTFCGGGGVSLGARKAGLHIKWAFDMNPNAGENYTRNFPGVEFFQATAEQFIQLNEGRTQHVDVLHLSPPCQTFSRAHTIQGRNDENNEASFFAVINLVRIIRPRFFTIEETDGIMDRSSRHFIDTALQGITELGYSFGISVMNALEYGVCQNRKRLIVIGAAPGEELPPFPTPTHQDYFSKSPRLDLQPTVTLHQALSTITRDSTDNWPNHIWQRHEYKPPYDRHRPFKNAIRAGGGEYDVYPDGTRKFTVRELACIQGFPNEYQFLGTLTDKRRIIGNAVPPPLSAALMGWLRGWMERVDFERME